MPLSMMKPAYGAGGSLIRKRNTALFLADEITYISFVKLLYLILMSYKNKVSTAPFEVVLAVPLRSLSHAEASFTSCHRMGCGPVAAAKPDALGYLLLGAVSHTSMLQRLTGVLHGFQHYKLSRRAIQQLGSTSLNNIRERRVRKIRALLDTSTALASGACHRWASRCTINTINIRILSISRITAHSATALARAVRHLNVTKSAPQQFIYLLRCSAPHRSSSLLIFAEDSKVYLHCARCQENVL